MFRARLSVTLSVCVYVICISEENGSVVPVFTVQLSFNDDHIAPHGSDSCNTAHLQRCSAGKQRAEQPSSWWCINLVLQIVVGGNRQS